jgi:hypothetical protein
MSRSRYTSGNVTIELDGGLDKFVRGLLDAAEAETVRVLEAAGDEEAARAERDWYGSQGVTRRTGKSGDIVRTTTFGNGEVRVSVGSTDTRIDPDKGKRVPYYVRRPGPLSVVDKKVTQGEWWAAKKAGHPVRMYGPKGKRTYIVEEPNPRASDGKYLVVELVRKPVNKRLKVLAGKVAQAIATRGTRRA